jgi:hypothetical protein
MIGLIVLFVGAAHAMRLADAPPLLQWLCEKHAAAKGNGFPEGWCAAADSDVCEWSGVECTRESALTAIELSGAPLDGPLDERAYDARCGRLILHKCNLSGAVKRPFFGVNSLNLASNELSGALPDGFFSSLSHVDVSNNKFTSVGNMCAAKSLHTVILANNLFSDDLSMCAGRGPVFSGHLHTFDVSNNKFWGVAPFGSDTTIYSISNNEFIDVQNAAPLSTTDLFSLARFGGLVNGNAKAAKESPRLLRCSIGKSAFASSAQTTYADMWFVADDIAGSRCK